MVKVTEDRMVVEALISVGKNWTVDPSTPRPPGGIEIAQTCLCSLSIKLIRKDSFQLFLKDRLEVV